MAAPAKRVGHYVRKTSFSAFLRHKVERLWGSRSFVWSPTLQQQTAQINKVSADHDVVPRKKTWSKEAVLVALASTTNMDPTAYCYQFQDDPYLAPRNAVEFKFYLVSQESGRAAAKFFVDNNPKFFTKDFAEPHIPCLMPESVSLCREEVSEEALKERVSLRKVSASVDMYDRLLQAGIPVSKETTYDLLDLICFYSDQEPLQEAKPEAEDVEAKDLRKRRERVRSASNVLRAVWRENNNAERIFNLLPERETRCYSALIRGMVKHGAYVKAYNMYLDLLNNRMTADVHIFNALILATPGLREKYRERWELITELLNQMCEQKVQPNLLTFNSVLKAIQRCGSQSKFYSLQTLAEMKVVGIAPSLATYAHIVGIFYTSAYTVNTKMDILQDVMSELEGTSFTCRDPDDVLFFSNAMKTSLDTKDMELGYKINSLVGVGENWKLLGFSHGQSVYYTRFFTLLCMMEHIDVVLEWYHRLIPSLYFPNTQGFRDLLQALDTDGRLDLLPTIWKDIRSMGREKFNLVEELLTLMAREKHSPEVQESFAMCALELKSLLQSEEGLGQRSPEWSTSALSHLTALLLRANKTPQAWEMLKFIKTKNRVPSDMLLEDLLSACSGSPVKAVELVQLSAAFCLPSTPKLAQQVLRDFDLNKEQRETLSELETSWEENEQFMD